MKCDYEALQQSNHDGRCEKKRAEGEHTACEDSCVERIGVLYLVGIPSEEP